MVQLGLVLTDKHDESYLLSGEIYLLKIPKGHKSHVNFHISIFTYQFAPPSIQPIYFWTHPIKTDASPWGTSHLKMNPPPLKLEAPFHEMIPRKSTNNNFKSS